MIRVREQLQELRSGERVTTSPKAESRRTITVPPHLLEELSAHLDDWVARGPDAFVFTGVKGGPLRRASFGVEWRGAVEEVGMKGFHFHDVRHKKTRSPPRVRVRRS